MPQTRQREPTAPHEDEDDELEPATGARIDPDARSPAPGPDDPSGPGGPGPTDAGGARYGGFLRRLGAYVVDSLIVAVPTSIVLPLLGLQAPPTEQLITVLEGGSSSPGLLLELAKVSAALYVLQWPYFAGFEASPWQATPGKRLLGLAVTDGDGRRVSLARATGRYAGKILSELLLALGYLLILVTERKQGLHDKLADTLVVRR